MKKLMFLLLLALAVPAYAQTVGSMQYSSGNKAFTSWMRGDVSRAIPEYEEHRELVPECRGSTSGGLCTTSSANASWVRIGKRVTAVAQITFSGAGAATGALCLRWRGAPPVDTNEPFEACAVHSDGTAIVLIGTDTYLQGMVAYPFLSEPAVCFQSGSNGGQDHSLNVTSQSSGLTLRATCSWWAQ